MKVVDFFHIYDILGFALEPGVMDKLSPSARASAENLRELIEAWVEEKQTDQALGESLAAAAEHWIEQSNPR